MKVRLLYRKKWSNIPLKQKIEALFKASEKDSNQVDSHIQRLKTCQDSRPAVKTGTSKHMDLYGQ